VRLHCSLIIHRGTYAWVLCCWLLCTYVSHRKHSKCLSSPHYIVPNFVFSPIANGLQNSKFIYIRVMWETSFYNRYLLIYYSYAPSAHFGTYSVSCQLAGCLIPVPTPCQMPTVMVLLTLPVSSVETIPSAILIGTWLMAPSLRQWCTFWQIPMGWARVHCAQLLVNCYSEHAWNIQLCI